MCRDCGTQVNRPSYIDGHTHVCCGRSKAEQCDDCPMKAWAEKLDAPKVSWNPYKNCWMRDGVDKPSWYLAMALQHPDMDLAEQIIEHPERQFSPHEFRRAVHYLFGLLYPGVK